MNLLQYRQKSKAWINNVMRIYSWSITEAKEAYCRIKPYGGDLMEIGYILNTYEDENA